MVSLRRTIYLTIYSSLDYEECAHKLMRMELKPGQEEELCNMILDCCCEMRTYEKFFGLLAQRFCKINKIYVPPFENMFKDSYDTVYRLKPNQLRNVAKFFAHLLFTDAISWEVLNCIRLNEEDTTSSGRIFIKIVFQELSEHMGLSKLNERVKDVQVPIFFFFFRQTILDEILTLKILIFFSGLYKMHLPDCSRGIILKIQDLLLIFSLP